MAMYDTENPAAPLRRMATRLAQRGVRKTLGSGSANGVTLSPPHPHGSHGGDDGYSVHLAMYDVDSYDDPRAVDLESS